MWPRPWHLKHLRGVMEPGLGRFGGAWAFCGAGFFCGKGGDVFVGLGGKEGLPLLKVCPLVNGLVKSLLKDRDFIWVSTLWAKMHTSSKVV